MSDPNSHNDFFSIPARGGLSDEDLRPNPVQPALDTLFSEFARRHRSLSPPTQSSPRNLRGHLRRTKQSIQKTSVVDLRALDYAFEYDPHLMCPICHVPFIDPVVLDCDHTFCSACFNEYKRGTATNDRSPTQCPSCRARVLLSPRRASRLIYNMCNDIKVRCPNEDCRTCLARGYIEQHVTRDCPEQNLVCPDMKCEKQTRRKNFVPGQCVHDSHVECDCGAVIELGRGNWLRHKDETCPNTGYNCQKCGERLAGKENIDKLHICKVHDEVHNCLGADFGCTEQVVEDGLENHVKDCTFARLAPYMSAQSRLLQMMQDQLTTSKIQNENLETELDRVNNLLTNQIQPRLEQITVASQSSDTHDDSFHDHENDIEEIPRDNIPTAAAIHHRDLLLPAHIRDLTPSPDLYPTSHTHSNAHMSAHNQVHMQNHLLSLHESLRHTVSTLEADIVTLHHALAELDARTSMQIMNETLRIKEDLAYTNAALVSHRSQVQWLLNRERIGREQAILRERGRVGSQIQSNHGGSGSEADNQAQNLASPGITTQHQHAQSDTFPFPSPGVGMTRTVSGSGSGSGPSSAATSPIFTGISMVGGTGSTRRPSIRGGSQERVKL